jgi:hypothetical protein
MTFEPKTIADHIDCLARLTGAPRSFVLQVKDLFSRKGISLEADAAPYLAALEEAFRREESIRASARRARRNIARTHENFSKIGRNYVRQFERMRKMQSNLRGAASKARPRRATRGTGGAQIAIPGDHRSIVTRQESDDLPMVPGPKEKQ